MRPHLEKLPRTDANAARERDLLTAMALTMNGEPASPARAETLNLTPDILLIEHLLTRDECDYLIDRSMPRLRASLVIDSATGRAIPHPVRTSDAASFPLTDPLTDESPAIHALNRRFAAASGTDVRQGEPLQVLRYLAGQEYRPHMDALTHVDNQRWWTLLTYLNDDYEGDETAFPALGLSIWGKLGDALLFQSALPNDGPDPRSIHAGLPVRRGVKLLASRWIRAKPLSLSRQPL